MARTPKNLLKFMTSNWGEAPARTSRPVAGIEHYRARRRALSQKFPGETLVIPTGCAKVRANDTHFRFRPGSDFFYLTGHHEPDGVLALEPRARGHRAVLYAPPNRGRSDASFFTDHDRGELWVGPRLSDAQVRSRFGYDAIRPLADLPRAGRVLRSIDPAVARKVKSSKRADAELAAAIAVLRLTKDASEVAHLRAAARATRAGFDAALTTMQHGRTEREIEVAFHGPARLLGNDVGYNVIAAAGANACILHWNRNDAPLCQGDLLLIDAGVESEALYTADVTRTFPISGRFSPPQREIYDLVRDAQRAALQAIRPGVHYMDPYRVATRVLAEGLEALGILPMSAKAALAGANQYFKRYTLHGLSHMLGIDVHDCAAAPSKYYRNASYHAGMVLTVEPGLYFQKNDLTVPRRYRGIGVRIEDDVLVTATGCKILTDIPRDAEEVEQWIAARWAA
jgi:Xaa-Pro aminopeptidase